MRVTDEHVAAVRAYLARDPDEAQRRYDQVVRSGELEGYGLLVLAAFAQAAYRRFQPAFDAGQVIRYVAAVRARWDEVADDVDPRVAEIVIRRTLGERVDAELDEVTERHAQVIMANELVHDERLDDAGLDEFMAEARAVADRWSGRYEES